MKFCKRQREQPDVTDTEVKHDAALEEAEGRANRLYLKAVELHTLVTRRDQENHWQQAVNHLFSGGKL